MWFLLLSVAVVSGLAAWQYWKWTHKRMLELAARVPGPPALPILGNALIFVADPEEMLRNIAGLHDKYGQYVRIWLGPDLNILVKNPTDIRALLTSNKVNKKGPQYKYLVPFVGTGILSGGLTWRNHRKIATPSYNKKSVAHFMQVFNQEAEQVARVISDRDQNLPFDVYKDVIKCTTQCVNQTLMGLSKEESQSIYRMEELINRTRDIYDLVFKRMTKWWLQIPPIYWLLGCQREQDYLTKLIDDFTSDIVMKRRKALEKSTPSEESMGIVDRFILSGDLSEQEIRLGTFTLFTSSQESAAKVVSGVLMLLSHLPDWQDKVYHEILNVVGPSGPVTSEQLKQLQNLDMVYKETLRYFSNAALIQRTVEEDITIDEGRITLPEGTSVVIPMHILHRDPRYWEEPLKVKPERFLPENVRKRDPNAFVPFSLGPMDCLGRVYATALIKTIVVWVLRHARLEPVGSLDNIKLHVAIGVACAEGYNVKAIPRSKRINGYV